MESIRKKSFIFNSRAQCTVFINSAGQMPFHPSITTPLSSPVSFPIPRTQIAKEVFNHNHATVFHSWKVSHLNLIIFPLTRFKILTDFFLLKIKIR